jgi:hypothetical protein
LGKTLVVFDTNRLRSTNVGGLTYGSFEFGSDFSALKSFINEKGLSPSIDLAVPDVVLQELLEQKKGQYAEDMRTIAQLRSRLSELPGVDFANVSLPDAAFDSKSHLTPLMREYVRTNGVIIIDLPEEKLGGVFKQILRRAIEKRPPFKQGKGSPDTGFKDSVIWESLLNFGNYAEYDKVILLTNDSGFTRDCESEFEQRTGKAMTIVPSSELAQTEIETYYQSEIKNKELEDFANQEYFKNYLDQKLAEQQTIEIDGNERVLSEAKVIKYADHFEEPEESETEAAFIIFSSIRGTVVVDGASNAVNMSARTYLDDTKGIQETEFEIDQGE